MKRCKMVFTVLSFLFLSGLPGLMSWVCAETANKVVAIVNDEVITLHELNERIRRITGKDPSDLKIQDEKAFLETQRKILDMMVEEKIASSKIEELGIVVTPREVDRALETIKKKNQLTQEEFVAQLKSQGMSYEKLRKQIKRQIAQVRILNIEVRSKIIIREEQIREYYEQNKAQFRTEGKAHLAAIVLKQEGTSNPDRYGPLYQKAKEILLKIRQGEDFSELARRFSQGPGAAEGGDLGFFKTSQLDPELVKTIHRMSPGDVTEPIIRPSAVQIIKLVEKTETKQKPLSEVRDDIQALLYQKEVQKRYSSWIKELKEKTYTKIFL